MSINPVLVPRVRRWSVLGCAVFLASCADRAPSGELHVDDFARLRAEPTLRIGSVADPSAGFSLVGGVDVDRDGNVYVLEASVPEVRVFTTEGTLVRRIGRRGGGPGEFGGAPRIGVMGDTLWTVDLQTNRITLFSREGTVLATGTAEPVIVPLPESYGHVIPWSMRPDGRFIGFFARIVYNRDAPPTGVQPTDRIPFPLVHFDASGEVVDTAGWAGQPPPRMWRPPAEDDFRLNFVQVGDRRFAVPSPPTVLPWWESMPDGYLVVSTPLPQDQGHGVFTVTRYGLAEDTIYSAMVHYRPVPYSPEVLDSIAAKAARGEPGGMVPIAMIGGQRPGPPENWEEIARRLRSEMQFPSSQLPIESVWVAQDESIWLRRWDSSDPTAKWLILDPNGNPRGELELPASVRPWWSRGDTFWATEPDEFDVPWLVRFEVN